MIYILGSGIATACVKENYSLEDSAGWQLRKDKNGIKVYTRDRKDEGLLEYRAITVIETTMNKLIEIIHDVENYPSWTENCETAMIYKVLSDTSRIEYMTTAVPWPLEDRDVVMEFLVRSQTADYFEARLTSVPEAIPEKEDFERIRTSEGYWIFDKLAAGKIEIRHQFLSDPGGNIPMWIVNMFIVSGPYKTLLNLKDACGIEKK
jgi:hypothetical protein